MFCVNYSKQQPPVIRESEEEIYSSLRKVRPQMTSHLNVENKHVTMIPLGSPRELHREPINNGTLIRITSVNNNNSEPHLKELIPKMRSENPGILPNDAHDKRDFEGWSGRAMEGRVVAATNNGHIQRSTNPIRGYWERNIQIEQRMRAEEERRHRPKSYGFPKWRSTDALSASLVASNSIQIPVDSRIPEERLRKMEETEREAVFVRKEIQEEATNLPNGQNQKLSKGKSLDSLNMQVDYKPWYDSDQIKSAVSRESIANIATSREFFETASQRDWRSMANSRRESVCSLSVAPPLPPKSDAVQIRQAAVQIPATTQQAEDYGFPTSQGYNRVVMPNNRTNQQQSTTSQFSQSQTSINRLMQQDSPQTIDPIEQQEVLLMLYLKQNMDIVQGLGIQIPSDLLSEMEDLQLLPVELRICADDEPSLFSPPSSGISKNGRYQRKVPPQMQLGQLGGSRQSIATKYGNHKRGMTTNSEVSNSNFDIFSQSAHYGYHQ